MLQNVPLGPYTLYLFALVYTIEELHERLQLTTLINLSCACEGDLPT